MGRVYIPYSGEAPAAVSIKGHRLLIVATTADDLIESNRVLGGDAIKELEVQSDGGQALAELAKEIQGGVVLSPPGMSLSAMMTSLEHQLPWVH